MDAGRRAPLGGCHEPGVAIAVVVVIVLWLRPCPGYGHDRAWVVLLAFTAMALCVVLAALFAKYGRGRSVGCVCGRHGRRCSLSWPWEWLYVWPWPRNCLSWACWLRCGCGSERVFLVLCVSFNLAHASPCLPSPMSTQQQWTWPRRVLFFLPYQHPPRAAPPSLSTFALVHPSSPIPAEVWGYLTLAGSIPLLFGSWCGSGSGSGINGNNHGPYICGEAHGPGFCHPLGGRGDCRGCKCQCECRRETAAGAAKQRELFDA